MQSSRASDPDEHSGGRNAERGEPSGEAERDREPHAQRNEEAGGSVAVEERRDLEAEVARMEDRYKRALADLDNYRKRSVRDAERRVEASKEALLRDWLETVDSVERALSGMDPHDPVSEGLRIVLDQMDAILARQGVQRIGARGERFDPERHEAVGVRPAADVPDRTILDVARSGFALNGRTLRPAEVIVSRDEGVSGDERSG
jgi:molecular chaperone GrpE